MKDYPKNQHWNKVSIDRVIQNYVFYSVVVDRVEKFRENTNEVYLSTDDF